MVTGAELAKIKKYYSRKDVQQALLEISKDREVVSVFQDNKFGKRPDILQYPDDIKQAVNGGAIAFHGSVERWDQPMKLAVGMSKPQLDKLRNGWDILIDMDVPDFEIAKIVTKQIIYALRDHGVVTYGLKYSGGKSFHIIVPFESMPERIDMKPISKQYPDLLQRVIQYLKWYSRDSLKDALLKFASPIDLAERVGKPVTAIANADGIDPFKIVDMDIFSSRHLFRLPYSVHEKSGLVSLPLKSVQLDNFKKEDAQPSKVKVVDRFLMPRPGVQNAEALLIEAIDWSAKHKIAKEKPLPKRFEKKPLRKIPEEYFPPCVQAIFNGLVDGKKRSVFVLINFLRNMGWKDEEVEKMLDKWNEKNYPPLPRNYLRSQQRWHIRNEKNILPPNCNNPNFYLSFGVCNPDEFCKNFGASITIKNPINYPLRKMRKDPKFAKSKTGRKKTTRRKTEA